MGVCCGRGKVWNLGEEEGGLKYLRTPGVLVRGPGLLS